MKKLIVIILAALALNSNIQAAITFLGTEQGTAGTGYAVQNWSNSNVVKAFDTGGDFYGSSGYYQIRPMPWDPGSAHIYEGAGSGNLLGTDSSSYPSLSSTPSFVSSISGGAGNFVNFGGYPIFMGPDGSSLYRQGALSVSVNNGPYGTPSGMNNGYYGIAFNFTVNTPTTFRFGLAVDTAANGQYAPDYVGIYSASTGTVYSSLLTRDGTPDMTIFEIDSLANETFTVSVWQLSGTQNIAPFSLATFDMVSIPEPLSKFSSMMAFTLIALLAQRKRLCKN